MEERRDQIFFWTIVFALLLLTRIPAMAAYLSIDNVNLAFSLEKFDPRVHQPQPPGYPLFVLFGRMVNFLFHDAERTFAAIALIVSALCLPAAFALGQKMFSRWAACGAVLLLLVNPVFWYSSVEGPLRPFLGLFSLVTAYCCWRCWMGEKRFAVWGAVALGVGSGFRPDLMAFLLPLWFISTWVGTKSWLAVLRAFAIMSAIVLVWVAATVFVMGGVQTFVDVMFGYAVDQSRAESVVMGSSLSASLRQISRLVIWNGLAVVAWIWALPLGFRSFLRLRANALALRGDRMPLAGAQFVFFFVWLVPGLIVQALIHVGAPGHTLFSVAALCVLGGYVLSTIRARDLALAAALVVNAMLFLDFFALPASATNSASGGRSIKNALLFGTFESSIGQVRWLDDITRSTLAEIREFTPKDRPAIIVTTDMPASQWFMNWRIARYYLPAYDFWVWYNQPANKRIEHIRRDGLLETVDRNPFRVPMLRGGRVLWLIEPDSALHKQLAATQQLKGGRYIFYSDITPDSPAINIDGFEIDSRTGQDGFQ